jgi:hypothetical protein
MLERICQSAYTAKTRMTKKHPPMPHCNRTSGCTGAPTWTRGSGVGVSMREHVRYWDWAYAIEESHGVANLTCPRLERVRVFTQTRFAARAGGAKHLLEHTACTA